MYARIHEVTVRNYNANNGIFADNSFTIDARFQQQDVSYFGINVHHQNFRVEKKDQGPTGTSMSDDHVGNTPLAWAFGDLLLGWQMKCITTHHGLIPIATFTRPSRVPNISNLHTSGCPAYVLWPELQARNKIDKWRQLGSYLWTSPAHASTVHLILSLITGYVSPQFYVQVDNLFKTLHGKSAMPMIQSEWQQRAGLCPKGEMRERPKVTLLDELVGEPRSPHNDNQSSTI